MDLPRGKVLLYEDIKTPSDKKITKGVDIESFVGYIRAFCKKGDLKMDLYTVLDKGKLRLASAENVVTSEKLLGELALKQWSQFSEDSEISASVHLLTKEQLEISLEINKNAEFKDSIRFNDWLISITGIKFEDPWEEVKSIVEEELGNLGLRIIEDDLYKGIFDEKKCDLVSSKLEESASILVGKERAKEVTNKLKGIIRRSKYGFWL